MVRVDGRLGRARPAMRGVTGGVALVALVGLGMPAAGAPGAVTASAFEGPVAPAPQAPPAPSAGADEPAAVPTTASDDVSTAALDGPPVLVGSSLTPEVVDLADGTTVVVVRVELVDADGVLPPTVQLVHQETEDVLGVGLMTRVSGTVQDGVWERQVPVGSGTATGTWTAYAYPFEDQAGQVGPGALVHLGPLEVVGEVPDTEPPVVDAATLDPRAADASDAPVTVTARLDVRDASGVVAPVGVLKHRFSGAELPFSAFTLVGDSRSGAWSASLVLPVSAPTGEWDLVVDPLVDVRGNTQPERSPSLATFTLVGGAMDQMPPELVDVSVAQVELDLADGPGEIDVQVRITDETGAVAPRLLARHAASGALVGPQEMRLVQGDEQDGVYQHVLVLPPDAATGEWEVLIEPLTDVGGQTQAPEDVPVLATVAVTLSTAPGAPAAPAVTFVRPTSVTVTWAAPGDDGGRAVTGYRVRAYVDGIQAPVADVQVTGTTATVEGLSTGTRYRITVAALNELGEGPQSAPSVTVQPAQVVICYPVPH